MKKIIVLVISCSVLLSGCLLCDRYTVSLYPLPNGRYHVVVRYDNIESYHIDTHSNELTAPDETQFLEDFDELVHMVTHPDEDGRYFGDTGIRFSQMALWVDDHTLYGEERAECSEEEFLSNLPIQKTATAYILDVGGEEEEEVKHLATNGKTMVQNGRVFIVWPRDSPVLEFTITTLEDQPHLERSLADLFTQHYPEGLEVIVEP